MEINEIIMGEMGGGCRLLQMVDLCCTKGGSGRKEAGSSVFSLQVDLAVCQYDVFRLYFSCFFSYGFSLTYLSSSLLLYLLPSPS